jgi:hypothetical protein
LTWRESGNAGKEGDVLDWMKRRRNKMDKYNKFIKSTKTMK